MSKLLKHSKDAPSTSSNNLVEFTKEISNNLKNDERAELLSHQEEEAGPEQEEGGRHLLPGQHDGGGRDGE